jgi:RNA polymerase subunit RPABC4/transcription elongation factor Spt4
MPEFPLLGSLNNYTILSASGSKLIIDGPFFTCDELNKNGWGIPESEAQGFAATFTGLPIRWCPMGKTVLDPDSGDIVAAEHFCDLINSQKTIVGKMLDVYPNGRNDKGNLVYWQKGEITDPATIAGIMAGKIPTNVSMWAYGSEMLDDGMVRGARGMSESIVTEPAYQEASFNYQIVAASLRKKGGHMGATGAYVPNNPKDYGKSTGSWDAPGLKDFTSKSWDDLTEQEKNGIRSCFAAVTDDTFGGCKLPHHNPNGTVVKAGVDNAMARLGQTQGLGAIKSDVEAHLRSHQVNDFKEEKGATMEPEKLTTQQVGLDGKPVVGAAVTPGVTINIGASAEGASKKGADAQDGDGNNAVCAKCGTALPRGADFCPKCGAALHAKCGACGTAVPVGAKFCPACGASMSPQNPATGTTGDNTAQAAATLQAAVADAMAKAKDEDNRRALAASIAEVQLQTGVITEADAPKKIETLKILSASILETQLAEVKLMAAKIAAGNEQGLTSGSLPGPMVKVGAGGLLPKFQHGLPPEHIIKAVFQRLGAQVDSKFQQMDWDKVFKYGNMKNFPGSANWKGTYHQDRELLPV